MEQIPVKHTVLFLVMFVTSTHCMFRTINVIEGDIAFLNFTYLCNSTKVTLQCGNGAPFYNSKIPTLPLSSNLKLRNGTDGRACFLYLTINPVTRDDQGGYILTAYQDDPTQYEDDRIQFFVAYPPGKASCSLSEEYIDPDWVRLQCTAPIGNIGGFIMCYQNGTEIPPLNFPQEHDEIFSQTLKARLGDLVYCCSGVVGQTKDRCECVDSVWDPIQNKQVKNVSDPCPPAVTTVQYLPFPQHPIDDNEFELTSLSTKTAGTPPQINSWKAVVTGLIVLICLLIILVIVIFIMLYFRKKQQRKPAKRKVENGVQESFITESV